MKIRLISATRKTETEFWDCAALGQSLKRVSFDPHLHPELAFSNSAPLPVVYNQAIERADDDDILIFIHDDVWLDDYFFCQRVLDGLNHFDVIGVAGNTRRQAGQAAWLFKAVHAGEFVWDAGYLSGVVAHGKNPCGVLGVFGFSPQRCQLLDGVFLAARSGTLKKSAVRFDPQFAFHFYDMDFCRSAELQGLRLGTWPIAITHQSGGAFGTPDWQASYKAYLGKWGE